MARSLCTQIGTIKALSLQSYVIEIVNLNHYTYHNVNNVLLLYVK